MLVHVLPEELYLLCRRRRRGVACLLVLHRVAARIALAASPPHAVKNNTRASPAHSCAFALFHSVSSCRCRVCVHWPRRRSLALLKLSALRTSPHTPYTVTIGARTCDLSFALVSACPLVCTCLLLASGGASHLRVSLCPLFRCFCSSPVLRIRSPRKSTSVSDIRCIPRLFGGSVIRLLSALVSSTCLLVLL